MADPRQLPERPVTPKHPGFHRAEHRRGDASCGDGDVQSGIGCTRDIAVTSPQLGLDGIGAANPLWGPGSWAEYVRLMFTNPAASSAGQDYTIANVILLPLFSTTDGYRRGLRRPWLYFVSSLFTSFAFAFAFYFATIERQHRHERSRATVGA